MKKQLIHGFFEKIQGHSFAVRYWDGDERAYGPDAPRFTIVFRRPLPVTFDISDPMVAIGEAYMDEILDFEGDFDSILAMTADNRGIMGGESRVLQAANRLLDPVRQKENIRHHYDLGNDFYALWLDESMSYSCAYFSCQQDSLAQAQQNKVDRSLRKLHLRPGDRLLDIGGGWGWLAIRAAREYGVQATSITLSEEQYEKASQRVRAEGLEDQVEIRLQDYLDLDPARDRFDRIVSIGMYEHVGEGNHHRYMEKVQQLLVPGGLSLLHTISGLRENGVNTWIRKYIFPGGYIPSLRDTVRLLADYDFHLLHAESLRLHYARTLDHWNENYEQHREEVEEKYGRRFARMWSLYLRGCAASFRTTGLDIYQILFSHGLNNDLPCTWDFGPGPEESA